MREEKMTAQEFRDKKQREKEKGAEYMKQEEPYATAQNEANEKKLLADTQAKAQPDASAQKLGPIELFNRNSVSKAQLDIRQQQEQGENHKQY